MIVRSRRYHGEFRDGKPNGYGEMIARVRREPSRLWEKGERNGSWCVCRRRRKCDIETLWKGGFTGDGGIVT